MNAGIKSLILLAATLVVGFALGLFSDATLGRHRRERLRDIQRPPGFVAHMEDVIRPHSEAQRDSIRTILERQAARNDTIMRATREQLRAAVDSMGIALSPMLDAEQRERLAREIQRGPPPFGRGGPGFGRGGPPFGGRHGGPHGESPRGARPNP